MSQPSFRTSRALLVASVSWCAVMLGGVSTAQAADPYTLKLDFLPSTSTVAVGYTPDYGAGYSDTTGRGFVTEASLSSANHVPLDLGAQTRQRTSVYSQKVNTLVHTQTATAPIVRGAYEVAVPRPGRYQVRIGVGDPQYFDSTSGVRIEGNQILSPTPMTSAAPFLETVGEAIVNDGKLTIDTIGGTNTKFTYLEITELPADTTPPTTPKGVVATGSTNQVSISWAANTEADLSGYDLYRSTTSPVNKATATKLNANRLTSRTYIDAAVTNGTQYFYAVSATDTTGNESELSTTSAATPTAPIGFHQLINFQPAGYNTPVGYTPDIGQGYDATRGFGFVRQNTLTTTTRIPLDIQSRMRARGTTVEPRLDTLASLVLKNDYTAAWEIAVPEGYYNVTVAAGDPSYFDSVIKVSVEGQSAIDFTPTTTSRMTTGTVSKVRVTDGRLTIDGTAGTNVKLQYVTVDAANTIDAPPPAVPTGVEATADASGVHVAWQSNTESDLAGYKLYRSTTLPVPSDANATPISGPSPVTVSAYNDTTIQPTQPYYYVLRAVNTSGGTSGASSPVVVTQPAPQIDRSFNFQPDNAPEVAGYTKDIGLAYTASRGYGWFRQDSLNAANHLPLDLTPNTRDRNVVADQRLDTFIHMQAEKTPNVLVKGAWEVAVPNGAYDVTVAAGEANAPFDSLNAVNVEGQPAISEFQPTAASKWRTANITVNVADGRLTLDANGGRNTKLDYVQIKTADAGSRPSIGVVQPADGAVNVSRSRAITTEVNLPNIGAGVDANTLNEDSVRLERVSDGVPVNMVRNTSAGGDVIVAQPRSPLEPNTAYRFSVTSLLHDVSGATFIPKTTTFTTGSGTSATSSLARFLKTPQSAGAGEMMASIAIGPDNRLYATTLDGKILRFPIATDGTLGDPTTITTVQDHENGNRHIIGITFDPASTPSNVMVWISHSNGAFANSPDWEGKISKLEGPNLETITDYVSHLPRSVRDHETNSLAFGPDGALYIAQGSNSAGGAADTQWGDRPERLLSAAILRLDVNALGSSLPLDAKTAEGGTYDPFAPGAPLTVYASGTRNSFDLVWHRNGQLYTAVNGSAAGGNSPATPSNLPASCGNRIDFMKFGPFTGPPVQGLTKIAAQPDLLVRAEKGAYYGHPNPSRCEWAFFGANPTNDIDPEEAIEYPVGTQPDRNFKKASFDLGLHFSPDGMIEYKGNAFSGALDGSLLVARYSAGDDVVALQVDPTTKEISEQVDGIPGLGGMVDPLDLAEDNRNGNVYVTELGAGRISLLKPDETGGKPKADVTPSRGLFNAVVGTTSAATATVNVRNSGNAPLRLGGIALTGDGATKFKLSHIPALPQLIQPDNEVEVDVQFTPSAVGMVTANLQLTTDDPDRPVTSVPLRGLGTAGEGGNLEPSLQRILDTHEIPINAGDDDPSTTAFPNGFAKTGDEVTFQSLRKAGAGKVTIEPIAEFAPQGPGSAVGQFGWNATGNSADLTPLFQVPNASAQRIDPKTVGDLSFDPGDSPFGLWASYAAFDYSTSFTEDALNTVAGAPSHQARAWPLKNADGTVVPSAYVVAFEDISTPNDFQDTVVIVRNVRPDGSGDGRVQLTNLDGAPFEDRLVFNRIGSLNAPPPDGVHDTAKVRVTNVGSTSFSLTSTSITGPFQLVNPPALPLTVPAGGTLDLTVKFVATSGRVSQGNLTIFTDSAASPTTRVQLAGYWQSVPENEQEPSLPELVNEMFGYGTKIVNFGQSLNNRGRVQAIGDEVLSPYWRRLDPSKGVKIQQLAAWHGAGNTARVQWFQRTGQDLLKPGFVHAAIDAQSALPHLNGSTTALAQTTIYPTAEFGFKMDSEWSDPALNDTSTDVAQGCTGACGHHVRAWPVKNRTGQIVPGSYIIGMDYSGINYDYQDNLYLMTNLTPDVENQRVLYRVDAGSTTSYTDTQGRVWKPDTGLFTPATSPVGPGTVNDAIGNTLDDKLYATTRESPVTANQADRQLSYKFPTGTATKVDIRLNFVERKFAAAAARRMNIYAEGVPRANAFDIFANAGQNKAFTVAYNGIAVADGALDLLFKASVDYPSIAGIEVLCAENCGSD